MTKAYLNYPHYHMTLHGDGSCAEVAKQNKPNQRKMAINQTSLSRDLHTLETGMKFGSEADLNDAWLQLDFDDTEFEEAVARHALCLLGRRYRPMKEALVRRHC